MRILVLDGDSNAACAIVQSLGPARYACWLAGPSVRHPAFASKYVVQAATYPDPLVDKVAFQRWVVDYHRAHRFALIVPPTECTLIPLHEIRSDAAIAGALALPPAEAVEIAFDKERVRALAAELGIPTPENLLVERVDQLSDPRVRAWLDAGGVVAKTIRSKVWNGAGATESHVRILGDAASLERAGREMLAHTPIQLQRWVPGKGIGVELLVDQGEIVLSFAHERVHEVPLTGGGSSYRRAIETPPKLLRDAAALVRALGWHGVAMVEFRASEASGEYWLMEINGRFWGSLPLAAFAGVDFPKAFVELVTTGRRPVQPPVRVGVYARNVTRDVKWTKAILRADRSDPRLLTRPLGPSLLEWGRVLVGRETWDGARSGDLGPIAFEVAGIVVANARALGRRARRAVVLRREASASKARAESLARARRVLVLCYGNICRSAYAETRLAPRAARGGWEVRSAGFYPVAGRSSPEAFRRLAAARGVDLSAHRSRVVDDADVAWADVVVIMDQKNHDAFVERHASAAAKLLWLGALDPDGPVEIADPYDLDDEAANAVLARLDRCLDRLTGALDRGAVGAEGRLRERRDGEQAAEESG